MFHILIIALLITSSSLIALLQRPVESSSEQFVFVIVGVAGITIGLAAFGLLLV